MFPSSLCTAPPFLPTVSLIRCSCDVLRVYAYDPVAAHARLAAHVQACFSPAALGAPVPYDDGTRPWSAVLDFVHRMRTAVDAQGIGVWRAAQEYLGSEPAPPTPL